MEKRSKQVVKKIVLWLSLAILAFLGALLYILFFTDPWATGHYSSGQINRLLRGHGIVLQDEYVITNNARYSSPDGYLNTFTLELSNADEGRVTHLMKFDKKRLRYNKDYIIVKCDCNSDSCIVGLKDLSSEVSVTLQMNVVSNKLTYKSFPTINYK